MGQNLNLPNVALVSLEVIVNTGDLRQTVDELTERCVTHPTTVDVMATPKFVPDSIVNAVEDGSYKPGELKEIYSNRLRSNAMSSIRQLNIGYNSSFF